MPVGCRYEYLQPTATCCTSCAKQFPTIYHSSLILIRSDTSDIVMCTSYTGYCNVLPHSCHRYKDHMTVCSCDLHIRQHTDRRSYLDDRLYKSLHSDISHCLCKAKDLQTVGRLSITQYLSYTCLATAYTLHSCHQHNHHGTDTLPAWCRNHQWELKMMIEFQ